MRKTRRDKGRPRANSPGTRIDPRAGNRSTSVDVFPGALDLMRRAWPGRPSAAIGAALRRVYGPEVPATLPQALYGAPPVVDGTRVTVRVPEAWLRLCRRERVTLSAVINDALVRVYILGQ